MICSKRNSLETILIVESHPVVLQVVHEILERAGYCILVATSGDQASQVDKSSEGNIDVAISDVILPDMSGPAAVTLLQAHRPDMGVILMSGYLSGDMSVLNRGWQFIEKPFLPYQLLAKVNEVLSISKRGKCCGPFDNRVEARAARAGA